MENRVFIAGKIEGTRRGRQRNSVVEIFWNGLIKVMKSVYDWREKDPNGEPWSPTSSERWHRLDLNWPWRHDVCAMTSPHHVLTQSALRHIEDTVAKAMTRRCTEAGVIWVCVAALHGRPRPRKAPQLYTMTGWRLLSKYSRHGSVKMAEY